MASPLAGDPRLACNQLSLAPLLTSKAELSCLAQVEELLKEHHSSQPTGTLPAPPSVLRGVLVRLKLRGEYLLRAVVKRADAAASDGKPAVLVQAPEESAPGEPLKLRRIPIASISSTNPLDDQHWEALGRAEAGRLAECWAAHGQAPTLAEAAVIAARRRAALLWHAQHWAEPPLVRQQHIAALLDALGDGAIVAEARQQPQQQLEVGQAQQARQQAQAPQAQQQQQRQQSPSTPPGVAGSGVAALTAAATQPLAAPNPVLSVAQAAAADGGLRHELPQAGSARQQHPQQQRQQAPVYHPPTIHEPDAQLLQSTRHGKHEGQRRARPAGARDEQREVSPSGGASGNQDVVAGRAAHRCSRSRSRSRSPRRAQRGPQRSTVSLPGISGLGEAVDVLSLAVRRAVPYLEAAAGVKRIALTALLRRGLIPFGAGGESAYRQLPLHLSTKLCQEVLDEVARQGPDVAGKLGRYAARGSPVNWLVALLEDVTDSRLLDIIRHEVQLHVRYLDAEYGTTGCGKGGADGSSGAGSGSGRDKRGTGAARGRSQVGSGGRDRVQEHGEAQQDREHQRERGQEGGAERAGRAASPSRRQHSAGGRGRSSSRVAGVTEPLLVPYLLRHRRTVMGKPPATWCLTSCQLVVSGVPPGVEQARLRQLLESAGGTVVHMSVRKGDVRGDVAYVDMATARQAAHTAEALQGTTQLGQGKLYICESHNMLEKLRQKFPHEAQAAEHALRAAVAANKGEPEAAPPSPRQQAQRGPSPPRRGEQEQRGRTKRERSPGGIDIGGSTRAGLTPWSMRRDDGLPPGWDVTGRRRSRSRSRSRSHSRSAHRGGCWDPLWRFEWACLTRLLSSGGRLELRALFEHVDVPSFLGPPTPACLEGFLAARGHLFSLPYHNDDRSDYVEGVPGAEAFLQFKRGLLECLADHPPRMEIDLLEREVPRPPGLAPEMATMDLKRFLLKHMSYHVWVVSGPKAYRSPRLHTVELCPCPEAPCFAGRPLIACPHFDGFFAYSCPDQERCPMSHARQRRWY